MKILLIMKRFSTNRDQITENFGREVKLFSEISRLGQNITVLCADQVKKERKTLKLNGMKVEIYPFSMQGIARFISVARQLAAENDIVVGTSHPLLGVAAYLAKGNKRMAYDLRDNYETYSFTNIPLLKRGLLPRLVNNCLIRKCDLAVCVSESLRQKIAQKRKKPVVVVENGVNTGFFKPRDKAQCRKRLGLPQKIPIIVYTGHISEERGADRLIEAFRAVQEKFSEAMLLLSGKVDKNISINHEGIIYKELPNRKDIVLAINSADVAAVPQPENETSRYAFPYKLMEYMACNVPVVATAVGNVKEILKEHPESLCQPENQAEMAQKIIGAIERKAKANYSRIVANYTWQKLARKLNSALTKLR